MKRLFTFSLSLVFFVSAITTWLPLTAHAAFNPNNIIDDSIFDNVNSMSAGQIDAWLNSNFGSTSCISTAHGFSAPDPTGYTPSGGFTYGGNVSAGQVIYDAAQAYGLNPEVLLVTLQKEQSLVTGDAGCSVLRYTGAVGYGCPDGGTTYNYSSVNLYTINGSTVTAVNGTCVNTASKAGFSQQLIRGTWLLKFGQQRAKGNTGWAVIKSGWDNSDDPQTCYSGPMTQGSWKRCSSDANSIFYDGYTTIDGSSTHMDDGATAALYWYTPHFSGNQHFFSLFTQWFGNPTTPCSGTANLGGVSGSKLIAYKYGQAGLSNLAYTQMNNTGSTCAEVHIDSAGFNNWIAHIATGMRATDPSGGTFVSSKSRVDNKESINYINYIGGGQVEVHRFSPDLLKFPGYYDVATNLSNVTTSNGMFVAGDFLSLGYDQLAYIIYSNSAGTVELHLFDPSLTKAVGYYDLNTNIGGVSSSTGTFVAGDFLGRGYAQLAYITYGNTEVHLLDIRNGHATRIYEVPTNLRGTSSSTGTFVAGDFLGRGSAQLLYVIYNNGAGNVETHMFNSALTKVNGTQDLITNIGSFDPAQ
jgi:hypothetical protein